MSNLCDQQTFSCTLRCTSNSQCAEATGKQNATCRKVDWLKTSIHYPKYACDTSRNAIDDSSPAKLCADVCYNTSIVDEDPTQAIEVVCCG